MATPWVGSDFAGSAWLHSGRVVVRRTFIEVMSDDDEDDNGFGDDERHQSAGGLCRRVWSDSALYDLAAPSAQPRLQLVVKERPHERDLSGAETSAAEALAEEGGRTDGASESSGGLDPSPSRPQTTTAATAGRCREVDVRKAQALLLENTRLLRENSYLRASADVLGQKLGLSRPPPASQRVNSGGGSQKEAAVARRELGPPAGRGGADSTDEDDEQARAVADCDRTTVMLRNLPNNYDRAMLLALLDEEGYAGVYNFVYLPIDFNSGASLGYAFVNLQAPGDVERFWQHFDGFSRWAMASRKVLRVSWSGPHQGLQAHIARYRSSSVMHESVPDEFKPALFAPDGSRLPFPGPVKAPRAPRMRHRGEGGRRQHQRVGRRPAAAEQR